MTKLIENKYTGDVYRVIGPRAGFEGTRQEYEIQWQNDLTGDFENLAFAANPNEFRRFLAPPSSYV